MSETSEPISSAPTTNPIVKILVALVLIVIVVMGVALWLKSRGGSVERNLAEQFIVAMDRGDLTAAKTLCVPEIDVERMQRLSTRMTHEWGEVRPPSLVAEIKTLPDGRTRADIAGQLEYDNDLHKSFTATMYRTAGGSYRISDFDFQ